MSNKREQLGFINQFPASTSNTAWEMKTLQVSGNALVTVNYDDVAPNMFLLQNPNDTVLHIGITNIPTPDSYEFKVEGNSSKTFGRPVPTNTLFILNKGNADITIQLFSVYDTFDMSVLVDNHLSIEYDRMLYDGIITGFGSGVSLPSGTNTIGKVEIAGNEFATMANDITDMRSMTLGIKNNQTVATDNTRDILNLMKGTYNAGMNEKNILNEMLSQLTTIATSGGSSGGTSGGSGVDYSTILSEILTGVNGINGKVNAQRSVTPKAFNTNIGTTSDDVTMFSYKDDNHTEQNPVIALDYIKWIRCDGEIPVTVKLYYSFADYITLSVAPGGELHDFDFPIYKVEVSIANSTDTGSSTINILGGKFK